MTVPFPCPRQAKPLDAGMFQAEISSFALHLAAEGKSPKTIRTYTEAAAWFAAAHLLERCGRTGWEQAGRRMCRSGWCTDAVRAAGATPGRLGDGQHPAYWSRYLGRQPHLRDRRGGTDLTAAAGENDDPASHPPGRADRR
jgi:hypothetical protein